MIDTTTITNRSHRAGEATDNYLRRLSRARLRKDERATIAALYERLDAERIGEGLPPAERAPWTPADILEWRESLTPHQQYLDLKVYAEACDRISGTVPLRRAA